MEIQCEKRNRRWTHLGEQNNQKLDDVSLVEQAIKYAVTGKKINEAYFHVKERR